MLDGLSTVLEHPRAPKLVEDYLILKCAFLLSGISSTIPLNPSGSTLDDFVACTTRACERSDVPGVGSAKGKRQHPVRSRGACKQPAGERRGRWWFRPATIKRSTRLVRPPPVSAARAGATRHAAELCAISVVRASDILCHHATSARPQ